MPPNSSCQVLSGTILSCRFCKAANLLGCRLERADLLDHRLPQRLLVADVAAALSGASGRRSSRCPRSASSGAGCSAPRAVVADLAGRAAPACRRRHQREPAERTVIAAASRRGRRIRTVRQALAETDRDQLELTALIAPARLGRPSRMACTRPPMTSLRPAGVPG